MKFTIVGAGISGLCTAWSLTKRGHQVTLVEKGSIPNPLSASGDQHRMIRYGYRGMENYARMMPEAFAAWDELWADLGETHYVECGILALSRMEGDEGDEVRDSLQGHRTFETLTPGMVGERYSFLDSAALRAAYLTRDGGVLLCQKIGASLARWLLAHGATLRTHARVVSVDCRHGRVGLASGEALAADRVLVAAGAWAPMLLPQLELPLTTYRTTALYLRPPVHLHQAWAEAPAIQTIGGHMPGYALPPVAGTQLKFASSRFKRPATDPDANRVAAEGEAETMRAHFAGPFLELPEYETDHVVTCAYTFTRDDHFYVRWVNKVAVLSACSGHGFKFGAAIGRRAAAGLESGKGAELHAWLRGDAVE